MTENKKSIGLKPEVFFKPQIWKNRPKGRGIKPNLSNKLKLIYQGAEAKIFLKNINSLKHKFSGKLIVKKQGVSYIIIKDRIIKSYRIKEIDDKIRKQRTKAEKKLLEKASKIINAPDSSPLKEFNKITMPFIDGKKLSEHLDSFPLIQQRQILKEIGEIVAKLHNSDIIHGDLTTSNMILVENLPAHSHSQINEKPVNKKQDKIKLVSQKNLSLNNSLAKKSGEADFVAINHASAPIILFIDFGLGYESHKYEDKAVDIHLLKHALEAKHYKNWHVLYKEFEKSYKKYSKNHEYILERLIAVERRGRYKH